ncbi:uncharacterized protein DUF4333 [Barrientosiimonas humi]|uniref:Uncharacterized protein DUF4333 n=1 Tax=Barrientosiimonas humi TaxID=999931 RepID=A0A542XFG0_9MICO|nr:DUF4333 domain-containing protein [Barrientosiimonas humi]TQL34557.1 uncharacterized protein DUF4333 [Barrientosiimonas humi]CAG7574547.1 hypothetical protein BH39T_PBIAJDOK_03203 [Barrientosiimonas humi]
MTTKRRTFAAAAAALALTAGLTGCSKEVDNGKVEEQLTAALKRSAPDRDYGKADCNDDLKAEVGETADCEIEVDGANIKYKATVKSVEGDTVNFEFTPG